jgi:lysine 2,3-aminomutase
MNKIIQNHQHFEKYIQQNKIDKKHLNNVIESHFTIKSPQTYLDKIDWKNAHDPLKLMTIPDQQENTITEYQLIDPIGDEAHLATKNLVHRYPDRVLLLLTNHCQINCRFCFRRELSHHATPPDLDAIITYLSNHSEVREVIFSGGDPLTLSPHYLLDVMEKIQAIPHIKRLRIHTRIPIVNPDHITQKYQEVFKQVSQNGQLTIVLHVNHGNELDQTNLALCKELRKYTLLLSQTVLLKDVNTNPKTLADLFVKLVEHNIKPYYLHHLDLVKGTDHFRISIEEGKKIYQALRGTISGQCIPEYVLDLPGGNGKVPVVWLQKSGRKNQRQVYKVTNFKNQRITYIDPVHSPT